MIELLCILLGLVLGQQVKVTISPELKAFITQTWSTIQAQLPIIQATITKTLTASSLPTQPSQEVI